MSKIAAPQGSTFPQAETPARAFFPWFFNLTLAEETVYGQLLNHPTGALSPAQQTLADRLADRFGSESAAITVQQAFINFNRELALNSLRRDLYHLILDNQDASLEKLTTANFDPAALRTLLSQSLRQIIATQLSPEQFLEYDWIFNTLIEEVTQLADLAIRLNAFRQKLDQTGALCAPTDMLTQLLLWWGIEKGLDPGTLSPRPYHRTLFNQVLAPKTFEQKSAAQQLFTQLKTVPAFRQLIASQQFDYLLKKSANTIALSFNQQTPYPDYPSRFGHYDQILPETLSLIIKRYCQENRILLEQMVFKTPASPQDVESQKRESRPINNVFTSLVFNTLAYQIKKNLTAYLRTVPSDLTYTAVRNSPDCPVDVRIYLQELLDNHKIQVDTTVTEILSVLSKYERFSFITLRRVWEQQAWYQQLRSEIVIATPSRTKPQRRYGTPHPVQVNKPDETESSDLQRLTAQLMFSKIGQEFEMAKTQLDPEILDHGLHASLKLSSSSLHKQSALAFLNTVFDKLYTYPTRILEVGFPGHLYKAITEDTETDSLLKYLREFRDDGSCFDFLSSLPAYLEALSTQFQRFGITPAELGLTNDQQRLLLTPLAYNSHHELHHDLSVVTKKQYQLIYSNWLYLQKLQPYELKHALYNLLQLLDDEEKSELVITFNDGATFDQDLLRGLEILGCEDIRVFEVAPKDNDETLNGKKNHFSFAYIVLQKGRLIDREQLSTIDDDLFALVRPAANTTPKNDVLPKNSSKNGPGILLDYEIIGENQPVTVFSRLMNKLDIVIRRLREKREGLKCRAQDLVTYLHQLDVLISQLAAMRSPLAEDDLTARAAALLTADPDRQRVVLEQTKQQQQTLECQRLIDKYETDRRTIQQFLQALRATGYLSSLVSEKKIIQVKERLDTIYLALIKELDREKNIVAIRQELARLQQQITEANQQNRFNSIIELSHQASDADTQLQKLITRRETDLPPELKTWYQAMAIQQLPPDEMIEKVKNHLTQLEQIDDRITQIVSIAKDVGYEEAHKPTPSNTPIPPLANETPPSPVTPPTPVKAYKPFVPPKHRPTETVDPQLIQPFLEKFINAAQTVFDRARHAGLLDYRQLTFVGQGEPFWEQFCQKLISVINAKLKEKFTITDELRKKMKQNISGWESTVTNILSSLSTTTKGHRINIHCNGTITTWELTTHLWEDYQKLKN